MRNRFSFLLFIACFIVFSGGRICPAESDERAPNIIFIMVDDLGWMDLGCMGSSYYMTPNIDKLSKGGATFTDAYMMPTCSPSRACFVTGQYPPRHGIYSVDGYACTPSKMQKVKGIRSNRFIDHEQVTFAEILKEAGYATAHIGKWHLGNDSETFPTGQGYDVNVGGGESGCPRNYFDPYQNVDHIKTGNKGEYLTDRLGDESCKFISANKDKPFMLSLCFYAVHVPLQAKKQDIAAYDDVPASGGQDNPVYGAMVSAVDRNVGKVLDAVTRLGLDGNTVIMLVSDNGGQTMCTSNKPLRGQKGNIYEGGIRVPLIVSWKGKVRPGVKCAVPVTVVDFYPTILDIAGLLKDNRIAGSVPTYGGKGLSELEVDGESILPLATETGKLTRDAIYWHLPGYNGRGDCNANIWQVPAGAIRKGKWKLIENFEDGTVELYDLSKDIGEQKNLAAAHPELASRLLANLKSWQKQVSAPIPDEPNDKFNPDSRQWVTQKIP
jgi:arylsulfatase A-like enzyme